MRPQNESDQSQLPKSEMSGADAAQNGLNLVDLQRSVVNIVATPRDQFTRKFQPNSVGSGFFVRSDENLAIGSCEIATDNHVVDDTPTAPVVYMGDGSTHTAVVEAVDRANDIAILRIDNVRYPGVNCKPVPLSNEQFPVLPGDPITRVGVSDFTFGEAGYINRSQTTLPHLPGENPWRTFITTSERSDRGNSGSPMANKYGVAIAIDDAGTKFGEAGTPSYHIIDALAWVDAQRQRQQLRK